jgi:hypothetical protein
MSKKLKEDIDFNKTLEQGVEDVMKSTSFDSGDDWAKVNTTFTKLLDDGYDVSEHIDHEEESNEQTSTGGASGSYSGPLFGSRPKDNVTNTKKKGKRIPNWESTISEAKKCPKGQYYCSTDKICKPESERKKEEEIDEATGSSSSGAYSTPKIWAKNKKNWRAVMDKNFPKYGGPGGTYVKIKDKCKKFPYCNQGDINALDFYEDRDIVESIGRVAKSMGIKKNDIINRLVEIKSTSNLGKRLRSLATKKAKKSKKESNERYMTKKELDEIITRKFYKSPITSLVGIGKMDTPIGKIYSMGSDAGAKHE